MNVDDFEEIYTEFKPWAPVVYRTLQNTALRKSLLQKLTQGLKRKREILLVGVSGVGKSQFVRSLKGDLRPIRSADRTESIKEEVISIGSTPFKIVDTPGHRPQSSSELDKKIVNAISDKISVVINVVCAGFRQGVYIFETEKEAAKLAISGSGIAKQSYLDTSKDLEILALFKWAPLIGSNHRELKVITLVNKADLWWPDTGKKIYNHYGKGEYYKQLTRFISPENHIVLPYCSVINPFFGHRISDQFSEPLKTSFCNYLLEYLNRCTSN